MPARPADQGDTLDIRKLQRAIVDGLEDVKAQNILVFNTEHLSPLFERVIIASGTSNRQTKALASSVRDSVKSKGLPLPRTEGEDNGEWIIVDCGAAVVHVMQPAIRDYYHLEEIWGDKPVKLKVDSSPTKLVKASEPMPTKKAPAGAVAKKTAAKKTAATGARKTAAKTSHGAADQPAAKKPAAKKAAAGRPAARKAATTRTTGTKAPAARQPAARPAAAKKAPARKAAAPARKSRA
jgi:ribosome-associated protein